MNIETVKVKSWVKGAKDSDFIIINKCDFDEKTHELFDKPVKKVEKKPEVKKGKK